MELFYGIFSGNTAVLDDAESGHCIRVLRHRCGDEIHVIDGLGTMARCRLVDDSPKKAVAEVEERFPRWGDHPYRLTLACCPTKNNDRFEWLVEKATEVGVDRIIPLIGERSERRIYKSDRARKIALAAAKQSLKAAVPEITEPLSVKDFLTKSPAEGLRLIAYCFEGETLRTSIRAALQEHFPATGGTRAYTADDEQRSVTSDEALPQITVLIGPEGDFSPEEARLALEKGCLPIHLGPSRLRTETAALTAAEAVYLHFL
ncbi:MAG: 16S rRNA (uracil(1498)-N(3))-methyltransferase [Bacteroidales bacterium]|nr:16S rRNA (uracil(1498)-N(3))-methyltransferase [Bacteroidales bacterium]